MAYRKRPATTRTCVHCHESYQAVDRRRLYCSSSCKVQACKAKRRRRLAAAKAAVLRVQPLAGLAATNPLNSAAAASPQTLNWNLQNIAVLGTAAAVGQLGLKLGEQVVQSFRRPQPVVPLTAAPPDPLSWLPPGLLTAAAPRVPLELPLLSAQLLVFVELQYLGHTLYYQPTHRALLWRVGPGQLLALRSAEQLALVAEQTPLETRPAPNAWLGTSGSQLQTLG